MKRFLIVINHLAFGGAERLVVDQINELTRLGHWVELLTLVKTKKPGFQEELILPSSQIHHLEINFNKLENFLTLRRFLSERKEFTIITHLFLANTLVRLAALFIYSRPKLITYEHNAYYNEKTSKHFLIDRILASFTHRLIAVSEEVRNFLIEKGLSPDKIILVENGIDDNFVSELPDEVCTRRTLGFVPSDLLVVSAGNVTQQKGYEVLKIIAPTLISKYRNLHFVVCGWAESEYAKNLKSEIDQLDLVDHIHFLGSRSDVLSIIKSADIFFMPSLWEGLSMALLEALVMGKCILTTDIPSTKTVINDSGAGLVFPPNDAEEAITLIDMLLSDPVKRGSYEHRAKEVSSQYSIKNNVSKLLEVIA